MRPLTCKDDADDTHCNADQHRQPQAGRELRKRHIQRSSSHRSTHQSEQQQSKGEEGHETEDADDETEGADDDEKDAEGEFTSVDVW